MAVYSYVAKLEVSLTDRKEIACFSGVFKTNASLEDALFEAEAITAANVKKEFGDQFVSAKFLDVFVTYASDGELT